MLPLVASALAFVVVFSGLNALAATSDFTVAATNVTMSSSSSSGTGSATFTLTSVNGYTGSVNVNDCEPPTPLAGEKLPFCGGSVAHAPYTLAANQVVMGSLPLYNSPVPVPASLLHRRGHGLATGLALAGALLSGLGLGCRGRRWITLTLLAFCALFALAGISACGNNNNYVTPGTYTYTVTATDVATSATVTATFNVTVP